MRYRTLGLSGIRVSEIGFGAWGIGGNVRGAVAYGPTDDRESQRAVLAAVERGMTFFDTSDLYGYGHSESVLGRALRGVRQHVVIASKGGMLDSDGRQDFSPARLANALHGSLRRLQTDYIDLYQLHSPPLDALRREPAIFETLEGFRRAGKVRAIGLSARSPDEALVAVREFRVTSVQVNFSLVDQRALDSGLLAACEHARVGVIARTPLAFGFLTGKYDGGSTFDPSDHRNRWSVEQRQLWADAMRAFVAQLGGQAAQTPAQAALRFCLSHAAVSSAIPGMLTAREVEENAAASDLGVLPEAERAGLCEAYRGREFFVQR